MTGRVPVYDTGMLIALADRKSVAMKFHEAARKTAHRPIVPGPVLAQVWRPAPGTVHTLSVTLRECTVPQARNSAEPMRQTSAGQVSCIHCAGGLDLNDWQRIGNILGTACLPGKTRPDTVDALVAFLAVRHLSALVFTSDPDDIGAYLAAFGAQDVQVAAV